MNDVIVLKVRLGALLAGRLILSLKCGECGARFQLDHAKASAEDRSACPHCRVEGSLRAETLKKVFERQMRRLTARLDHDERGREILGLIIAKAVGLFKPVLTIVLLGQFAEFIGHQVNFPAIFLARLKESGGRPVLVFTFVSDPAKVANSYLMRQWDRHFIVTQAARQAYDRLREESGQAEDNSLFNFRLDGWGFGFRWRGELVTERAAIGARIPVGELDYAIVRLSRTYGPRRTGNLIDLRDSFWAGDFEGLLDDLPPPFHFTDEEHQDAAGWLEGLGLDPGRGFVCFLGFDYFYYQSHKSDQNFNYFNFRVVDIKTYLPAMNWLADQGLPAIRLGSVARERLNAGRPEIVDYPFLPRTSFSEFLDVYLGSHCRFYVTCDSGPDWIPVVMKRPVLFAGGASLSTGLMHNLPNVFVACRLLRRVEGGDFLTFREIFEQNLDIIGRTEQFRLKGAFLEPLKGDETQEYVQEMLARVEGRWEVGEDEQKLQRAFQSLVREFYPGFELKSKPLYSFLRRYRRLLET